MNKKIQGGRLIALRAPAAVDPTKDVPDRLLMFKWGDNATTKGNFRVTKKTLDSLAANQRKAGFDEVVIDFEHNTVPNHPANRGEPAAIAARGKPVVIENEGLFFDSLSWTEPGKSFLQHYHDLSPVVARDADDNVIFVHSAALCRNGATYNLHAFNAQLDLKTFALTTFADPAAVRQDPSAAISTSQVDVDLLRRVLQLSTLSADATPEDINRALADLASSQIDTRESDQGGNALSAAAVKGLVLAISTLTAEVKSIRDGQTKSERDAIVEEAVRDGKVIPKECVEGAEALSNSQLRALVATLPEIVPMEKRTPEHIESLSHVRVMHGPDEEVRKHMGISTEAWQKHNGRDGRSN